MFNFIGLQVEDLDIATIAILVGLLPQQFYSRAASLVKYVDLLEFRSVCNELRQSIHDILSFPGDTLERDLFYRLNQCSKCL